MTNKFCVVGSPIVQSLSPVLHSAAYRALGLSYAYEAHEVSLGELSGFLGRTDFQGVSVTMPLKVEAFTLATQRSSQAVLTTAANTLTRSPSGWTASNTDIYGLTTALLDVPRPERTVVIGAGATTFSALTALSELFPETEITLMARDQGAVERSVEFGSSVGLRVSGSEVTAESIVDSDLVLNLVPAGSFTEKWSEVSSLPRPRDGWLFDASYNPWPSLPATSWATGKVISGLEMLIWQAIEQVHLFAASAGDAVELDRQELYVVMKSAVSSK
jgi:shikimate dehydrogenase